MMKPDAVAAIAHKIDREWGVSGYSISRMQQGPVFGSAIAEVWHADGSIFWVGSDKWGNTVHGDTQTQVVDALLLTALTV